MTECGGTIDVYVVNENKWELYTNKIINALFECKSSEECQLVL